MINLSSLLNYLFLHFNCETVARWLIILSGVRAALYFPETPMTETSWSRDAYGNGVFIDPCINILLLGRVRIVKAIKKLKLFLALSSLSSAAGIY